jgi:hypothetical protein
MQLDSASACCWRNISTRRGQRPFTKSAGRSRRGERGVPVGNRLWPRRPCAWGSRASWADAR